LAGSYGHWLIIVSVVEAAELRFCSSLGVNWWSILIGNVGNVMLLRVVSLLKFEDQLSIQSNLLIIEQTLTDQQLKMIKRTDSMLFLALQKPKGLLSQR
jgi:hypothetical protein